jgi:PPK2 family polyphosphate:nucleotide phosphotransferase
MDEADSFAARFRVSPGTRVRLDEFDPRATAPYAAKANAARDFTRARKTIVRQQQHLWAEHRRSVLIVLQALDTGGKDGTIRHVFGHVNPLGCQVWSFKAPTQNELDHDFLWRYHAVTPPRGTIGIFNRSHYEDVLIVRVHNLVPHEAWRPRYELINQFEQLLIDTDTTILKFFLHISRAEQRERLLARRDDPRKAWKFSLSDVAERKYWDAYQAAYEDALSRCSTDVSPWYLVPSDHKWFRNVVIARIVADTLTAMDPQPPLPDPELATVDIPA